MWRSDPCYASYGVDGSTCSFFIYLSEVSNLLVFRRETLWCVSIFDICSQTFLKTNHNFVQRNSQKWKKLLKENFYEVLLIFTNPPGVSNLENSNVYS